MPAMISRLAVLLVGAALLLPGRADAASPFAGRWRGTWTDAVSGQSGDAAVGIGADGQVDGTVRNGSFGQAGPLRGTVADDGTATLRYTYDKGRTTYRALGTFQAGNGQLTGEVDFLAPDGTRIGHGQFRFTPATPAAPVPGAPSAPGAGGGKSRQPVPDKAGGSAMLRRPSPQGGQGDGQPVT